MADDRPDFNDADFPCRAELTELLSNRFWKTSTADQCTRLNELVTSDLAARQLYVQLMFETAVLAHHAGGLRVAEKHCREVSTIEDLTDLLIAELPSAQESFETNLLAAVPPSRIPTTYHSASRGPGSLRRFVRKLTDSPRVVTLLVAAAFYGIFGYLAWDMRAQRTAATPDANATAIAIVSDVIDVRWPSETSPKQSESPIHPGESLKIDSGILHLKLKRGVQLLVEGPAEWSIESDNRAQLHMGRLIARVPKDAIGFTLDTPTARVIDLGTEFGVEVNKAGAADVSVLQGRVKVQPSQVSTPTNAIHLTAGDSAHITPDGARVEYAPTTADRFSRLTKHFATTQPRDATADYKVLFYYRLGEDDPNKLPSTAETANRTATTLANVAAAFSKPLAFQGVPLYTGDVAAPISQRAFCFSPTGVTVAVSNDLPKAPDNWVFEVWVRADVVPEVGIIAYWGEPVVQGGGGFGLGVYQGKWAGLFGSIDWLLSNAECEAGKWTHLALVRENNRTWLMVNGVQASPIWTSKPLPPEAVLLVGGYPGRSDRTFAGAIDELRFVELKHYFRPNVLLLKPLPTPASRP